MKRLTIADLNPDGSVLMPNLLGDKRITGGGLYLFKPGETAHPEPRHVLRALGLDDDATRASLRFGLGRFNTEEEVDFAMSTVAEAVDRLRRLSSFASDRHK